eukprot:879392-Pyramimonas_sp.AAC.1
MSSARAKGLCRVKGHILGPYHATLPRENSLFPRFFLSGAKSGSNEPGDRGGALLACRLPAQRTRRRPQKKF